MATGSENVDYYWIEVGVVPGLKAKLGLMFTRTRTRFTWTNVTEACVLF